MICGKHQFRSVKHLRRALRSSRSGDRVGYYVCPECGFYHMTGTDKKPNEKEIKRPMREIEGNR